MICLMIFFSTTIYLHAESESEGENVFTLDELTVKERIPSAIEDSTSTSVVKREDIVIHSDRTLDDSLKNIPGIQVGTHKKGSVRASFRGFDQNRVAIMIDGIPLYDVYSTDIDISNIPVSEISEIVVNRGSSSALYGTMGSLGVINIITRIPDREYYEVRTEYGLPDSYNITASAGTPYGKYYFRVSGEYDHGGGYGVSQKLTTKERRKWFDKLVRYDLYGLSFDELNMPAVNGYINDTGKWDHTQHDRAALSIKLGRNFFEKSEWGVAADYNYKSMMTNSYQHNAFSNYSDSKKSWEDPVFDISADPLDIKSAAFRNRSFVWPMIQNVNASPYINISTKDFKLSGNIFVSYKSAEQEKYADTDHIWPGDTVLADTELEPALTIKEYLAYGSGLTVSYKTAKWNKVSAALLYRYNVYYESEQALSAALSPSIAETKFGLDPYPVKHLEVSYFTAAAEDEVSFGESLTVTAGISYDTQNLKKFKHREALYQFEDAYIVKNDSGFLGTRDSFNPVAGIIWAALKDRLIMRGTYSIKTRFPDLSEYSMIVDDKRDNSLKAERSRNINTGAEFLFFSKALSVRGDYFYSSIENRIEKIAGGLDPPINIGEVTSQGLEAVMTGERKNFRKNFTLKADLSYTYIYARSYDDTPEEKVNKGKYLEYTPVHQICADLRVRYKEDISFTLWGYMTVNQIAYAMKSRPEPEPTITPFSTKYFEPVRLNDPMMVNARVSKKIFDNYEIYAMCRNIFDDYSADPFIPGPGRIFYMGGSAEF